MCRRDSCQEGSCETTWSSTEKVMETTAVGRGISMRRPGAVDQMWTYRGTIHIEAAKLNSNDYRDGSLSLELLGFS